LKRANTSFHSSSIHSSRTPKYRRKKAPTHLFIRDMSLPRTCAGHVHPLAAQLERFLYQQGQHEQPQQPRRRRQDSQQKEHQPQEEDEEKKKDYHDTDDAVPLVISCPSGYSSPPSRRSHGLSCRSYSVASTATTTTTTLTEDISPFVWLVAILYVTVAVVAWWTLVVSSPASSNHHHHHHGHEMQFAQQLPQQQQQQDLVVMTTTTTRMATTTAECTASLLPPANDPFWSWTNLFEFPNSERQGDD
jgi:hypothetical protein